MNLLYNNENMARKRALSPEEVELAGQTFEKIAKENGRRFWNARDVMANIGESNWQNFKKSINRAISICATLGIDILENFTPVEVKIGGRKADDYKLSRLACCFTLLNGDPENATVARLQAHLVGLSVFLSGTNFDHIESADRISTREDIAEREITLSKTAAAAGVEFYDRFKVAGYRGMYEMDYQALRRLKGVTDPKRSLLDFMGKDELAGNLFRLTLTDGRIKRDGVRGQTALEHVAEDVGRTVRRTMIEQTGIAPEGLRPAQDIRVVRKGLKEARTGFGKFDDLTEQRKTEAREMGLLIPAHSDDAMYGCPECAGGDPASHEGSPDCTSGSIASGGTVAHCRCDYCY
ncbi:MAG TPA: hypothetical protein VFC21_06015 [Bryobacteraceae bacterium]|nr:hypothetical protein [Bryobacteraceae bacterium]